MTFVSRLVWIAILLGTLAAASANYYFSQANEAEQVDRLSALVSSRLNDQLTILEGVSALYLTHKLLSKTDNNALSDSYIREYLAKIHTHAQSTGIQGIGIITATTPENQASRLASIRANYGPDAHIWPTPIANLAYPITFIEPYDTDNSRALGFDMYSEAIRRRAIQRAWTSGNASASNIVSLVQTQNAKNPQPGFLLFIPVRDSTAAPTSRSGRNDNPSSPSFPKKPVEAFVYAPILVHDLISAMLAPSLSGIAGVRVYAGTDDKAPLIYERGHMTWGSHHTTIRIADREWKMVVSYQEKFNRYGRPIIIFIFGTAIALLFTRLNKGQRRRIDAYRALAEEKARHAEDRELIIGEMAHRLKNAFARIGALARITIRESANLAEFETRFDGRLRALADTKQMMIVGGVASFDLAHLIHREMELAGVAAHASDEISGPPIHLGDEGAQAIALIIHELVTNSIKYGALSGTGHLAIHWTLENRQIQLSWIESDLASTPNLDHESFGTHFIRSLIQRQLRGDWQRSTQERRLNVIITWPDNVETTA